MIDPHIDDHDRVSTTNGTLRQFAALCLLFFGGMACWQYFGHGSQTPAVILAILAGVLGLGGLALPALIKPVFVTAMAVTYPIGWVVSRVLLGVLFFGLFTPMAILFRLIGRDALHRRRQPHLASYWAPKAMPTDVRSYLRQS